MNREVKMKELQLLDATRRKFLTYQQQQKESELSRLDDEIRRKVGYNLTIKLYMANKVAGSNKGTTTNQ